jgi:hypothetical protein
MTKKTFRIVGVLQLLALMTLLPAAQAGISPIGIGIVPPIQFPPENFSVTGVRVNPIFGSHHQVYGLDAGVLGNITLHNMGGVQVAGGFNYNKGDTAGLFQAAGVGNWNISKVNIYGAQIAGGINSNKGESFVLGVVAAIANITEHTKVVGVEVGAYNSAREVYGFQIGIVNKVENLHGLQIGVINFHNRGLFSVSPIINFGF